MNPQVLVDGLITGALIGLGAIGVTLTYSILRFANFAHGEFITFGAYAAMADRRRRSRRWSLARTQGIGALSISPALIARRAAGDGADRRLRAGARSACCSRDCAARAKRSRSSWRVSAPRWRSAPRSSSSSPRGPPISPAILQIARPIAFGLKATPDQIALLIVAGVLLVGVHLLLSRTQIGRAMRAVSENPALARAAGVDVDATIRVRLGARRRARLCGGRDARDCWCRSGRSWASICCCRCSRRRSSAASAACPARLSAALVIGVGEAADRSARRRRMARRRRVRGADRGAADASERHGGEAGVTIDLLGPIAYGASSW